LLIGYQVVGRMALVDGRHGIFVDGLAAVHAVLATIKGIVGTAAHAAVLGAEVEGPPAQAGIDKVGISVGQDVAPPSGEAPVGFRPGLVGGRVWVGGGARKVVAVAEVVVARLPCHVAVILDKLYKVSRALRLLWCCGS
jgi:hypothetical protein